MYRSITLKVANICAQVDNLLRIGMQGEAIKSSKTSRANGKSL
jgi:hypothetical protein